MSIYLAVLLLVVSIPYLLYTSWKMQQRSIEPIIGYGQILVAMGGLTWGMVAWYPYTYGFTGNLSLFAGTTLLLGAGLTLYGRARQDREQPQ